VVLEESIVRLRNEGKTYDEIVKVLGCAKSTVCYYCGDEQRFKQYLRRKKFSQTVNGFISSKLGNFKTSKKSAKLKRGRRRLSPHNLFRNKVKQFKSRLKRSRGKAKVNNIKVDYNYKEVKKKIGKNPICYLTGKPINLDEREEYNFDHINPVSKGGTNDLKNLGLSTAKANKAKSDLTVKEFIFLCGEVLEHHGYEVKKRPAKRKN
jgi:hypothetical protein